MPNNFVKMEQKVRDKYTPNPFVLRFFFPQPPHINIIVTLFLFHHFSSRLQLKKNKKGKTIARREQHNNNIHTFNSQFFSPFLAKTVDFFFKFCLPLRT